MSLSSRQPVCAIVGAGPGLSFSVARRFGSEGFAIGLVSRREESLAESSERLQAEDIRVAAAQADAGDFDRLRGALEEIGDRLGPPTVLVYNVFSPIGDAAVKSDPEQLLQTFRQNALGALVSAQAVAPSMAESGEGTILLTSGALALRPFPGNAALSVGKVSLRWLGLMLAADLKPSGIHVATANICMEMLPGAPNTLRMADIYWRLHSQQPHEWDAEVTVTEDGGPDRYPGSV